MKSAASDTIDRIADELIGLSHRIHSNPELAHHEVFASDAVAETMLQHGFEVERSAGGLGTAIRAVSGEGSEQVVLCAEYDALPDIGHACGHNVVAASSVGAAIALSTIAEALDIQVVLLGTPAEERGGGKISLLRAGLFDGAALAAMVHPGPHHVVAPQVLALHWMTVTYRGRPAHAAAFPELGVNAADAATIAQVAIGLARQQMAPTLRVHGILKSAGSAANIIPDFAKLEYMVRAPHLDDLSATVDRVLDCFRAGAMATGAELDISENQPSYAHLEHDTMLGDLYRSNAEELGAVFNDGIIPPISTDMGNVSLSVPTLHPMLGINSLPAVNHQPEFASAAASPAADSALLLGAKALAWTVIETMSDPNNRRTLKNTISRLHTKDGH